MTTKKLMKLIDDAVELDRAIRGMEKDLKACKDALKAEAASREEEHVATEGGGWSWQAQGESGAVCRVTQEGDKLKSSVAAEKDVAALKEACGEAAFRQLFEPGVVYRPVNKVRLLAEQLLSKTALKKVLKLLTGKGTMKVGFETKEGDA